MSTYSPSLEKPGLRYVRVADSLRDRMREGVYGPGERLPRQHDLASEYNVAFSTLKQALDLLEREGYVVRKVGQGTYASLPRRETPSALAVDDDGAIRGLFIRVLGSNGWECTTADSGPGALEKLAQRRFDLVFLDLVMPGMNGARAFREIRNRDPEANVVIITGYPSSDLMAEALQVGPFAVMKKPFATEDIRLVLRLHSPRTAGGGRASWSDTGTELRARNPGR